MMQIKKEACCGCGACRDICPKQCIQMKLDAEGFRYPAVSKEQCIHCGKCEKVCPVIQKDKTVFQTQQDVNKVYAVMNKNESVRQSSSSGGVFSVLAEYVLGLGGYVAGAIWTEDFLVKHMVIDNEKILCTLYGSKYLQSDLSDIYKEIRKLLDADRYTLFCGTPCQCAALRSYLGKDYDKLIIVDIICHGVPSEKAWKEYLKWKEERHLKVTKISFRDKTNGWKEYNMKICYENGDEEVVCHQSEPFFKAFLHDVILRPSCYCCSFKGKMRNTDLTLGDCWGSQQICPEMDDDLGLSVVLIHSRKGENAWNIVKSACKYEEIDMNEVFKYNPAAIVSATKHLKQKSFYRNLGSKKFDVLVEDTVKVNFFQKVFLKVKRKVRYFYAHK